MDLYGRYARVWCARAKWLLPVAALVLPGTSMAAGPAINSGDTAWLLTSTALVLFMTLPGLAAFYGGLVRSKNVLSVLMQCFGITCVISLLWLAGAYGLIFDDGGGLQPFLGSLRKAMFAGVGRDAVTGTTPELAYAMFQLTFAVITPALVVGGLAERTRFSALLWFAALWFLFVYVPVCHWVWGNGWLARLGVLDFAGGLVVHVNAGVAALVAALYIGRRRGFPGVAMPPHSMPLTVLGAGMLWVGWYGFNAGSALMANGNAAMAMFVTHIGASAGALTWMALEWSRYGRPSLLGIATGMVAGLGTITPASGYVGPVGAVVIGIAAGLACFSATNWLKRVMHVDDTLDVSPVHGVGGVIGTILTGVFVAAPLGGIGFAPGMTPGRQVAVQLLGVVATAAWCATVTWILLRVIDAVVGMRVSDEQEAEGLDLALHGERGYIE